RNSMTAPLAEETEAKSMSWPCRALAGKLGHSRRTACPPRSRSGTPRSDASRATRSATSNAPSAAWATSATPMRRRMRSAVEPERAGHWANTNPASVNGRLRSSLPSGHRGGDRPDDDEGSTHQRPRPHHLVEEDRSEGHGGQRLGGGEDRRADGSQPAQPAEQADERPRREDAHPQDQRPLTSPMRHGCSAGGESERRQTEGGPRADPHGSGQRVRSTKDGFGADEVQGDGEGRADRQEGAQAIDGNASA